MTNDSTHTPETAKPERYGDYLRNLSREALERECLNNWLAIGEICDFSNEIEAGEITDRQFVEKVQEYIHDGLGISVRPDEPWRKKIRKIFPTDDQEGNAA